MDSINKIKPIWSRRTWLAIANLQVSEEHNYIDNPESHNFVHFLLILLFPSTKEIST